MAFVDDTSVESRVTDGLSEASPGDYFQLLKPRVMSLVVFTALVGMLAAPGTVNPVIGAIAILCIAVGAGASGALNMWYDADIDATMTRTAKRPIPAGRIMRGEALVFALVLSFFAVLTLGVLVNWLAAALLAFTIFFYAVIYTMWLKRSTPQNIVIGGAAGAFPPVIGWAAATGTVSLESLVLFAIIFLWTPPHFWALALFRQDDYRAVSIPMMPIAAGEAETKRQILAYSVVVAAVGVLPWLLGFATLVYGIAAALLGALFIRHAWAVYWMPDGDTAMRPAKALFGFSIIYLFALFALLLGEALVARAFPGVL